MQNSRVKLSLLRNSNNSGANTVLLKKGEVTISHFQRELEESTGQKGRNAAKWQN